MTEPTENNEIDYEACEKTKCSGKWRGLKIFLICMAILALMQPIFGKFVPQLLFGNQPSVENPTPLAETIEEPAKNSVVNAQTIPEKPEDKTDFSPQPENPENIEPTVAPTAKTSTVDTNSDARLQKLEEKITQLEAELAELKNKQEAQNTLSNQSVGLLPSLVIFGQLKDTLLSGLPYNDSLSQIRNLSANNEPAIAILDKLIENSEYGIIPESELIKQFSSLAQQVMVGKNSGWLQKNSQKFITIRKVGEQEGKDDEAVIARAEALLNSNPVYLYKAIAELNNLSQNAKEIFADWLANAAKLQDAKASLERLQFILTRQYNQPQAETQTETKTEQKP